MQPTELLVWIIIGAIAGWLAGMMMKSGGGLSIDMGVGVVGALIGGFLFSALNFAGTMGFNIWRILVAFVGAFVLVTAICLINERRRHLNEPSRKS